jgi:hypothetical protein
MRAFEDPLDVDASTGRWRALLQRLRGYRKTEVLLDREPFWVPLVDLQVPPRRDFDVRLHANALGDGQIST